MAFSLMGIGLIIRKGQFLYMRLQSCQYKNIFFLAALVFLTDICISPSISFSENNSSKKDYFFKKIVKNEINALKKELAEKEKTYKNLEKSYLTIAETKEQCDFVDKLNNKVKTLQESLAKAKSQENNLEEQVQSLELKLIDQKNEASLKTLA